MRTRNRRDQLVRASGRARKGTRVCPACGSSCGSWRGVGQHLILDRNDGTGGPVCMGVRSEMHWGEPSEAGINLRAGAKKNTSRGRGRPSLPAGLRLRRLEERLARSYRQLSYWRTERTRARAALSAARGRP